MRTFCLCIVSLVLVPLCLAAPGLQEVIECGEDSESPYTHGQDCYTAVGYTSGIDACRAAQQGLKDDMVSGTSASCDDDGCDPASCQSRVRCMDDPCSLLTVGQPYLDQDTMTYNCSACWAGGQFLVHCTACE